MPFTNPSCWSDVYLAATVRAISAFGDLLAATALVLAVHQRGAGGYAVAAILLAAAVPPVLLAPLTGRLADRVDSRTLLVVAGTVQVATCVAMALVRPVPALVALATLLAAGLALTSPVLGALVPAMVRRDDLSRASAISQTASALGAVVGPALAGLLMGRYGVKVALLVDAVGYLALVGCAARIRTRRGRRLFQPAPSTVPPVESAPTVRLDDSAMPEPGTSSQPADNDPAPAAWRIRDDGLLWPLLVLFGVVAAALNATSVIYVFFVRDDLHASATMYGILEGAFAAGMPVGAWAIAQVAVRDGRLAKGVAGLLAGLSAAVLAAAAMPQVTWLIGLWLVAGALNGALNVWFGVLFARRVPAAVRGRAFARIGAVGNGAATTGYLIGGALVGVISVRATVGAAGLAGLVGVGLLIWPLLKAARSTVEPAQAKVGVAVTVGPAA